MNFQQDGFINGGILAILIGSLALGGLLLYGYQSGHELPLWPAIAVALVNLAAAARLVFNIKKAKQQQQSQLPTSANKVDRQKGDKGDATLEGR